MKVVSHLAVLLFSLIIPILKNDLKTILPSTWNSAILYIPFGFMVLYSYCVIADKVKRVRCIKLQELMKKRLNQNYYDLNELNCRITIFRPHKTIFQKKKKLHSFERIGKYSDHDAKASFSYGEGFAGICWKTGLSKGGYNLPSDSESLAKKTDYPKNLAKRVRYPASNMICVPVKRDITEAVLSFDVFDINLNEEEFDNIKESVEKYAYGLRKEIIVCRWNRKEK